MIEHDGGPQPVADDVYVAVLATNGPDSDVTAFSGGKADLMDWSDVTQYEVLNQHLIDAALKRGIELGLEAAEQVAIVTVWASEAIALLRALDPATIAKDAGFPARKDHRADAAADAFYVEETAR